MEKSVTHLLVSVLLRHCKFPPANSKNSRDLSVVKIRVFFSNVLPELHSKANEPILGSLETWLLCNLLENGTYIQAKIFETGRA